MFLRRRRQTRREISRTTRPEADFPSLKAVEPGGCFGLVSSQEPLYIVGFRVDPRPFETRTEHHVNIPRRRIAFAGVAALAFAVAALGAPSNGGTDPADARAAAKGGKTIPFKDARLKLEINATDRDGGVQLFIDADSWKDLSVFDPAGKRVLSTTTTGSVGRQGGTELFMESAEPPFTSLPVSGLLKRFPAGRYAVRATGLKGERIVGSAVLTHDLPDGPVLVSPRENQGPQRPDDTTVVWRPVPPANGSPIIGYQVLVVRPDTGIRALPKVILDVMMPPTVTRMKVPPGFLVPGAKYEWEVLAIEVGGNQTLSSNAFTTGP